MGLGDEHHEHLHPEVPEGEDDAEAEALGFRMERGEHPEDEEGGNHVGWEDDPHPSEPEDFATGDGGPRQGQQEAVVHHGKDH